MTLSVVVDPIRCDAFGYCAELLPERVRLDEWGYPVVDDMSVNGHLVDAAAAAARECPRRALLLVRTIERASPDEANKANEASEEGPR